MDKNFVHNIKSINVFNALIKYKNELKKDIEYDIKARDYLEKVLGKEFNGNVYDGIKLLKNPNEMFDEIKYLKTMELYSSEFAKDVTYPMKVHNYLKETLGNDFSGNLKDDLKLLDNPKEMFKTIKDNEVFEKYLEMCEKDSTYPMKVSEYFEKTLGNEFNGNIQDGIKKIEDSEKIFSIVKYDSLTYENISNILFELENNIESKKHISEQTIDHLLDITISKSNDLLASFKREALFNTLIDNNLISNEKLIKLIDNNLYSNINPMVFLYNNNVDKDVFAHFCKENINIPNVSARIEETQNLNNTKPKFEESKNLSFNEKINHTNLLFDFEILQCINEFKDKFNIDKELKIINTDLTETLNEDKFAFQTMK